MPLIILVLLLAATSRSLLFTPHEFGVPHGYRRPREILPLRYPALLCQRSAIVLVFQNAEEDVAQVRFPREKNATPASVIGAAVSGPAEATTGKSQAIPAMALLCRVEIGPLTNSRTSETERLRTMLRALPGGSEFVSYLDAIGEIDGQHCLIDWKTTTSRYSTEPEGLLSLLDWLDELVD